MIHEQCTCRDVEWLVQDGRLPVRESGAALVAQPFRYTMVGMGAAVVNPDSSRPALAQAGVESPLPQKNHVVARSDSDEAISLQRLC